VKRVLCAADEVEAGETVCAAPPWVSGSGAWLVVAGRCR
jgi:hypothetical protein